jgi:hypothetical protein
MQYIQKGMPYAVVAGIFEMVFGFGLENSEVALLSNPDEVIAGCEL